MTEQKESNEIGERAPISAGPSAPQKKQLLKKREVYPSKTSINLCIVEKKPGSDPAKVLPAFLLFLILAAVFTKFAVIDRINELNRAEARVPAAEEELEQIKSHLVGYDDILAEFKKYSMDWMNESELILVNRIDALNLADTLIMTSAVVTDLSIDENNIMNVQIYGLTLTALADMVTVLNANPLVEGVEVNAASSNDKTDAADVATTLIIQLVKPYVDQVVTGEETDAQTSPGMGYDGPDETIAVTDGETAEDTSAVTEGETTAAETSAETVSVTAESVPVGTYDEGGE